MFLHVAALPSTRRRTGRHVRLALIAALLLLGLVLPAGQAGATISSGAGTGAETGAGGGLGPDQLTNSSFEAGDGGMDGWSTNAWQPTAVLSRDTSVAAAGSASARIQHADSNDSWWQQELHLTPNTPYELSGWIRTDGVSTDGAGANLSVINTWTHTTGLHGTNGWTQVGLKFSSGASGVVTVGARLGYWAGTSTGTAWFDALQVNRITAETGWKVQLVIHRAIDTTIVDQAGVTRHVRSSITPAEVAQATDAVRAFVTTDIPALDSRLMVPSLLPVAAPTAPLTTLSALGNGEYYPGPGDGSDRIDPRADSVIAVWNPWATDVDTGETVLLSGAAGLTPGMGSGQTYATAIIASLTSYGHRNVLKHEYGHSLLSYFEAIGASPVPTVTNHANAGDYVHCGTGAAYVWVDETLAEPIPNSIYSNRGGFTHDYYSGTTAVPTDPGHCLGITRSAWAAGGPVSMPPFPPLPATGARTQLSQLTADVQGLASAGTIRRSDAAPLLAFLNQASTALDKGRTSTAARRVESFTAGVDRLEARHRIGAADAHRLTAEARQLLAVLDPRHRP